jgi:anthranilate phosphoribosyltransferase
MTMKQYIEKCLSGAGLTADEASDALDLIMTGQATDVQVAGLLIALRAKGETVEELVGFARTMRAKAIRLQLDDPDAIDMCGTGGDGHGTFNISTVATFVAAGAGVTVAKHGNKSVSSRSGSADLLAALGVNIQISPEQVQECVNRVGVGFLFAPLFHPAMKFVSKSRGELGVRTVFNMLGPITNPAGVRRQLVGTYRRDVASIIASALGRLATTRACVVHSEDGLDEVSASGETSVFETGSDGTVRSYAVSPDSFGLQQQPASSMAGGDARENATIALTILKGDHVPGRHVVVANAALGIFIAGKAANLLEATSAAIESIDAGRALASLNKLIDFTSRP